MGFHRRSRENLSEMFLNHGVKVRAIDTQRKKGKAHSRLGYLAFRTPPYFAQNVSRETIQSGLCTSLSRCMCECVCVTDVFIEENYLPPNVWKYKISSSLTMEKFIQSSNE